MIEMSERIYIDLLEWRAKRSYFIKDRILLNQDFSSLFNLDGGAFSFPDKYESNNYTVGGLVKWIEKELAIFNHPSNREASRTGWIAKQIKIAEERVLPKLKTWKPSSKISIP